MDTISRENNSMLPVAGVIVGVLALLFGGYAAIKVSSLGKTIAEHQVKVDKVEGLEATLGSTAQTAEKAKADVNALSKSTQDAVNQIAADLGGIHASLTKMEDVMKKPAPAAGKAAGGPVVAGPGEYVIKPQDSFAKIARAHGVSQADIAAVNPGVDSSKLKVGQKIKLPKK